MYNHNKFSNRDYVSIGKLMTHIFNKHFAFLSCRYFSCFRYQFCWLFFKLLKRVKCERLFENIMSEHLFLMKKWECTLIENAAYAKKRTSNPREESITEDPQEEPSTQDSRRKILLRNLKRDLSLTVLKENPSLRTLKGTRNNLRVKTISFWIFGRVKRFYTKIFVYFKRTLNVWESFLILVISAVICKQRKLHEKEVTQHFRNQKYYKIIIQFRKALIMIAQLKKFDGFITGTQKIKCRWISR